jgi:hypothetical protein
MYFSVSDNVWEPSEKTRDIMDKNTVTPTEVYHVIEECFCHAHGDCEQGKLILSQQARKTGMDCKEPDLEGLMALIPRLVEVAKTFRDPEIIQANKRKITNLLKKCRDPDTPL